MKILIAGSRHYPSRADVDAYLKTIDQGTTLVLPASPGPARWAAEEAGRLKLPVVMIPTESRQGHEASATALRNQRLAEELGPGDQAMLFLAIDPKHGGYSQTLKELAQRAKSQGASVAATRPGRKATPIEAVEAMPFLVEEPTIPATLFDLFGEDPSHYDLDHLP